MMIVQIKYCKCDKKQNKKNKTKQNKKQLTSDVIYQTQKKSVSSDFRKYPKKTRFQSSCVNNTKTGGRYSKWPPFRENKTTNNNRGNQSLFIFSFVNDVKAPCGLDKKQL